MSIEKLPLHVLASLVLICAEACAYVLKRPFLQPYEIRVLIAYGATDYLFEMPHLQGRSRPGHVSVVHEVMQHLDFVDSFQIGRIPEWSHFALLWFQILNNYK